MNHQTHDAYNYSHIIPETINIIKNKDSCVNQKNHSHTRTKTPSPGEINVKI